ncbi:hypothetical protein N657DRAFT_639854 [Parathielavia appendiculata]|uniref:Uncharacterized protein n=1 Tax=Parathielavia appendiculata TaxID=2587402 RepID=A0AAN6UA47_9PEZI|nr:hypothetical protein N657DRAFT_639854 [Parathielavia appendiculata]
MADRRVLLRCPMSDLLCSARSRHESLNPPRRLLEIRTMTGWIGWKSILGALFLSGPYVAWPPT